VYKIRLAGITELHAQVCLFAVHIHVYQLIAASEQLELAEPNVEGGARDHAVIMLHSDDVQRAAQGGLVEVKRRRGSGDIAAHAGEE
jgi:hypothetical protein